MRGWPWPEKTHFSGQWLLNVYLGLTVVRFFSETVIFEYGV